MSGQALPAAGLAVAGVIAVVLGFGGSDASVRATAFGIINDDRPDTLDAHTSPAAAADPARPDVLVVVDRIDTPMSNCAVSWSTNAGVNWEKVPLLPLPAGADNCFWPDVTWTGDGGALVLFSATGGVNNQPVGTWAQRLEDGKVVGEAVVVSGDNAFHPRIAADGDRVVATWVQAGPNTAARTLGFAPEPNPLMASVSTDGGRTFGPPVSVSDPALRLVVPSVVVGDGTVVLSALDLVDDELDYSGLHEARGGPPEEGDWRVLTWTSTDGGATFGPAVVVAEVEIPQRINPDLSAPRPGLARDRSDGRLYTTWEAGMGSARDVFVSSSDDDGATWSSPTAVVVRRGTQTLPSVDVAGDGRVDVVFYDRSVDPTDVRTEVAQASSWDGGRTFTVATVSARRFDSRIGLGSFQDLTVNGTQTEVVSGDGRAVAFWSDSTRATMDDNRLDLAVALVRATEGASVRVLFLAAGVVLLGAAVATAVGERRPKRR